MLTRLTKLRERMLLNPEHFEMTTTIDRGLAYDKEMGIVLRKNPEVTRLEVRQIVDHGLPGVG